MSTIRMNSFKFLIIVFVINRVFSEDTVKSLCDDPVIHSADRLVNNTYRVYRDDYYWELEGLSAHSCKVKGPFRVSYPNMGTIDMGTAITTVINGKENGTVFKWKGQKWWSWDSNGKQLSGGKSDVGNPWHEFPPEGFTAAFNDGDLDGKGHSMMIAFAHDKVYHFNTQQLPFIKMGESTTGGIKEEFLPSIGITAALPFPSTNKNIKYYVYLFKSDQYCFRRIRGERREIDCTKMWTPNKQLFGCPTSSNSGPVPDSVVTSQSQSDSSEIVGDLTTNTTEGTPLVSTGAQELQSTGLQLSQQNILFILILFIFLF